jgi:cytochrome c556
MVLPYQKEDDMQNMIVALAALLYAGVLLADPSSAFAHEGHEHGNHEDAQMKKLHAMMPTFSRASAELGSALDRKDAATATAEAGKILAAIPDLKRSKPHKNIKQVAAFRDLAGKLGDDASRVRGLVAQGDFAGATAAFKKLEGRCAECHTRFRD